MKNFTFIKNVKGGLTIKLQSYDMMLPERLFTIASNVERITIPEQYALGLFVSDTALDQYREGYFQVEEIELLQEKANTLGLFVVDTTGEVKTNYSKKDIDKAVKEHDSVTIDKIIEKNNYLEINNLIAAAREHIDSLPKSIVDKIGNACGVDLEIE